MKNNIYEQVPFGTYVSLFFLKLLGFYLATYFFRTGVGIAILLGTVSIIMSIALDMYIYLPSATRLILKNTLEIKLPFRKPIVLSLAEILEIELTGKWSRSGRYYIIKYEGGNINTYLMSVNSRMRLNEFMEELQHRVDDAKKEVEN